MNGQHLYIIQSSVTGAVKIGRSSNPDKRLESLQTGSPHRLRLIAIYRDKGVQEKGIHMVVQRHRLKDTGEWFHYDCLQDLPEWIYEGLPFDDRWFLATS